MNKDSIKTYSLILIIFLIICAGACYSQYGSVWGNPLFDKIMIGVAISIVILLIAYLVEQMGGKEKIYSTALWEACTKGINWIYLFQSAFCF